MTTSMIFTTNTITVTTTTTTTITSTNTTTAYNTTMTMTKLTNNGQNSRANYQLMCVVISCGVCVCV